MKLEIKNGRILAINASDIGEICFSKNGFYFLVQILDILVWFDGVYSREWE